MKSLFIFLSVVVFSCKSNVSEGDLCFKKVRLIPEEGFKVEKIEEINDFILKGNSNLNSNEIKIYNYYSILNKNNLLSKNNFYLKIEDKIIQVFINDNEYLKIKPYKLNNLLSTKEKVRLKLSLQRISDEVFITDKIISIKVVSGETHWDK